MMRYVLCGCVIAGIWASGMMCRAKPLPQGNAEVSVEEYIKTLETIKRRWGIDTSIVQSEPLENSEPEEHMPAFEEEDTPEYYAGDACDDAGESLYKKSAEEPFDIHQECRQRLARAWEESRIEQVRLYKELASAYVRARMHKQAIAAYEKVLVLEPNAVSVYYFLGLLYHYSLNDSPRAIACYQEYITRDPHGMYAQKAQTFLRMLTPGSQRVGKL